MATACRWTMLHGRLGAFDQFVLHHQSMVYNVAYRILGNQELATKITQATFSRAFQAFSGFRSESARLWLMRIVTSICHDRLRRGSRPCPDSLAESDSIQRCLSTLPPEQRITLVLSDIGDLSYREIAQATGVPVGVVSSRLSQGRARLRDELLAQGVLLPEGCPAKSGLPPVHAGKTIGMRSRTDDTLEDQIGHLSQRRIGHTADA